MTGPSTMIDAAALLSARRAEIAAAMARYLTGSGNEEPTRQDSDAAARLVDILITALREPGMAATAVAGRQAAERYYSRFGDGLSPILKDILGADADAALLSRTIDGYWRAVRTQLQ